MSPAPGSTASAVRNRDNRTLGACAAVFLATLAAYWPMLRGGQIWDDDAHVTKPMLRSLHGLWRIWFDLGATQQYYPVLHSAFWFEHRLWGDATLGYHLTNVFLHATVACLFAVILRRLWWPSDLAPGVRAGPMAGAEWLAAFLFALHPVGVESVAWISEQKNTLSAVFYLLSALVYLNWVGTGGPPVRAAAGSKADTDGRAASPASASASARPHLYFLALGLFVLAVLSKSVTSTLPAALLVVLWWQRGTLSWRRDIVPLVPWFAIGAAAGLCTAWVERRFIGAEGANFTLSLLQRCLLAGRVAWFYLAKLVWPTDLIFIYPHWTIDAGVGWQSLFSLGALALIAVLWLLRRRSRGPLAGALFFVGTLFPALGFFNVYPFIFSYVADHFQYLASLGIIALAAAAWAKAPGLYFLNRKHDPGSRGPAPLLPYIVAIAVVGLLGGLTWRQSRLYRDPEILYRRTLEKNPGAWITEASLGVYLVETGKAPEAIPHYERAVRLEPTFAQGYYDLGNALSRAGRLAEAIDSYRQAVRLKPYYVDAHNNLGVALAEAGRVPEAVAEYEQALQLQPDHIESYNNLGNALLRLHRPAEAIVHFQTALRLNPRLAEAHYGLGLALAGLGRLPAAITEYEQALRLKPDYAQAHANLAGALANTGKLPEAIAEYEAALRLEPGAAAVHYNLGLALRLVGRTDEAQAQLEEASRLEAKR
jgi:tetratricopeptide (TPR) repeat protein